VNELKDICKMKLVAQSGKKSELIARIIQKEMWDGTFSAWDKKQAIESHSSQSITLNYGDSREILGNGFFIGHGVLWSKNVPR
jgi:hypothetical protein